MQLACLKSGSDIRGTAVDTEKEKANLTEDAVFRLACAFARRLDSESGRAPVVAVGHDSRISSVGIKKTVIRALCACGCNVLDCGLASTPSMFMMTKLPAADADAAVMITASHHPYDKNGLKFFTRAGGLSPDDISALIAAAEGPLPDFKGGGSARSGDYLGAYTDWLVAKVRANTGEQTPLQGFKVVVDASSGAGGFFVGRVLKPLGADTGGSQNLAPDGYFPAHAPNPENAEAMAAIAKCVKANNADFGIIFDTDVDRAALVAGDGKEVNRNRLIALTAACILRDEPGATIVTDSVTSAHLTEFIENLGGVHHRFKRGYKNVIDEAARLQAEGINAAVAIETSGHAALKENFFLDDGAYLVLRILSDMTRFKKEGLDIMSLLCGLREPAESLEVRLSFRTADFKAYGDLVLQKLAEYAKEHFALVLPSFEGVRANVCEDKGWFLLRQSVHDPILPLNIESDVKGGCKAIAQRLYGFLKGFELLDTEKLEQAIGQ